MPEWSGAKGRRVLDATEPQLWTGAVDALNQKGWFIEGELPFLEKDVIRPHVRGIKIRMRKRGYVGPGIEYFERNIGGVNGYAFYCQGKATRTDVQLALDASINRQLGELR